MAKKTTKQTNNKAENEREALAKELKGLIPKLDSPGLAFLVQQARVHLYNMKVDELNDAKADILSAGSALSKAKSSKKPKTTSEKIKIIGTESGSSFYLYYGNNNIMLSKGEMTHLIKMVNAKVSEAETGSDIGERLFRWFERERMDVFSVIPIKNKFDERLKTLAGYIKKNYKLQ